MYSFYTPLPFTPPHTSFSFAQKFYCNSLPTFIFPQNTIFFLLLKQPLNFRRLTRKRSSSVYPFLKNEYKYFYGDCFLSFPFYLYFALKLHKTKPLSVYIKKDPRYKANKAFYKILRKLFSRYKIGYCDFLNSSSFIYQLKNSVLEQLSK